MKNLREMKSSEIFAFTTTDEVASDRNCNTIKYTFKSPECAIYQIDCDVLASGNFENVQHGHYLLGFNIQVTNGVVLSEVEFNSVITHLMSIFNNHEKLESFNVNNDLFVEFKPHDPEVIECSLQQLDEIGESDFIAYMKKYALISR